MFTCKTGLFHHFTITLRPTLNTKIHINNTLQETKKGNHGHCPCLRTEIPNPAFLPSHPMYQHTSIRSGHKFKTRCIKEWFIFRYINSLKSVENQQDFLGFSSSLVLGCKAPWTSLLLSCKNTRTDHDSSDLDKDKLLWNCTSEMKSLIAAKPTKWLAATEKSSSIQVCPNWYCYSIKYSVITYFLWWCLFSSSSACHGHHEKWKCTAKEEGENQNNLTFFALANCKHCGYIRKLCCISTSPLMFLSTLLPFVSQHPQSYSLCQTGSMTN